MSTVTPKVVSFVANIAEQKEDNNAAKPGFLHWKQTEST
jgi:hypothetical protein